jgi:hypothetical protein
MTTEETALFKSVAGDRDPPGRRCRELVLAVGRRGGKDAISALICANAAMAFQPDGRVRAHWSCCSAPMARNLLRYVRGLFEIPALKALITRETQDGFELSNGCDHCGKPSFLHNARRANRSTLPRALKESRDGSLLHFRRPATPTM